MEPLSGRRLPRGLSPRRSTERGDERLHSGGSTACRPLSAHPQPPLSDRHSSPFGNEPRVPQAELRQSGERKPQPLSPERQCLGVTTRHRGLVQSPGDTGKALYPVRGLVTISTFQLAGEEEATGLPAPLCPQGWPHCPGFSCEGPKQIPAGEPGLILTLILILAALTTF